VRFDYKADESDQSERVGFIAQEVLPVLPHAVTVPEDSEQMMSLSTTEMIPVLVKAIQQLKEELDAAKAEIAALKGV
jgi:uroporphyrinogen-III decarboxylase